jgi:hypothetical protein
MYPLGRPHLAQRLTNRVLNFGIFLLFATWDALAIVWSLFIKKPFKSTLALNPSPLEEIHDS